MLNCNELNPKEPRSYQEVNDDIDGSRNWDFAVFILKNGLQPLKQ